MKRLFIFTLCILSNLIYVQSQDSIKTYQLPAVEVISKKTIPFVDKYE